MRFTPPLLAVLGMKLSSLMVLASPPVLAPLFTDGVVLQRDRPIPVWGTAEPGAEVVVRFQGEPVLVRADAEGRWRVNLPARGALATSAELKVTSGGEEVTVRDVVVGEVWLCAGQSNMQWPVARALEGAKEVAAARYPMVRQFKVEPVSAEEPAATLSGGWTKARGREAGQFTAVGYFFGRELHRELGVPVGLINASWGATMIEAWMPAEVLAEVGPKRSPPPRRGGVSPERDVHAGLYNGMIYPLGPVALAGVIWYQGERNAGLSEEYARLFPAMIEGWRERFGGGELPFYFVQLAGFGGAQAAAAESGPLAQWPWQREAQAAALAVRGTGMVTAIDLGEERDIHPGNKQEVGQRLASLALARLHGRTELVVDGPRFLAAGGDPANRKALRVRFDPVAPPMRVEGELAAAFQLAGEDGRFVPADEARLEGDEVVVSAAALAEPVHVRYAWAAWTATPLRNAAGLPALPFRTDSVPPSSP